MRWTLEFFDAYHTRAAPLLELQIADGTFPKHAFVGVFRYLRIYGEELYEKSRRQRSLEFCVDVVAFEMSKALKRICQHKWRISVQHELLRVLLAVDRQPAWVDVSEDPEEAISLGVRLIQIGLALFYLEQGMADSVAIIIDDLREDQTALGKDKFQRVMEVIYSRLRHTGPEFWEDTDRGNESLYHTSDKNQIQAFRQRLDATLDQPSTDSATKEPRSNEA